MTPQNISNEQLYELLKEFRADHVQLKTDMNRQFSGIREDIHDLKDDQREIRQILTRHDQRLGNLESKIDNIQISWSTRLVGGIFGTSAVTAGIVAFFMVQVA